MTHVYWRLYYHLVWATRQREQLILPEIEIILYDFLDKKVQDCAGYAYSINGMPDHIHMIVKIQPTIALAKFMKDIKGSSSHFIKEKLPPEFGWQVGYSAFTISERNLSKAILYVQNQKQHHQLGTIIPALEALPGDQR